MISFCIILALVAIAGAQSSTGSASTGSCNYTVVAGDFSYSIATKFGCNYTLLAAANPQIVSFDLIQPGTKFIIPTSCSCHAANTCASKNCTFSGMTTVAQSTTGESSTGQSTTAAQSSTGVQTSTGEAGSVCYYTVLNGDTSYDISAQFGCNITLLAEANSQIADMALIYPGDRFTLPATCSCYEANTCETDGCSYSNETTTAAQITTGEAASSCIYTIVKGDKSYRIAYKFGCTLKAIRNANPQIDNLALIYPNEHMTIPDSCSCHPNCDNCEYGNTEN
jgi:LysM repeat protein